jgi:Tfp pilus assembly protein PilO
VRRVRSVWRSRAWLFALLGLLVAANVAFLVSYQLFYDTRLQALQESTKDFETKRDAARQAAEKVKATQARLESLQTGLEEFYRDSLGTRKERLASVIEDVYAITSKSGLRPDDIGFAEAEIPGAVRFQLTFGVAAKYPEVKRLLSAFESIPG